MDEGYTNTELLEGCFTKEMIAAFLKIHGYTREQLDAQKPSVMSELILSLVLDEEDSSQLDRLMKVKLQLLRVIEKEIEKNGDGANPRYQIL